ncbi:MAG: hypothetical protein SFW36_13760 [Leptolyngbyaceae cyanobacterium bins.59]|nr:hypothetical protein [Leptolyngbyaceae cyanobacterium bins.59]
MPPVPSILQKIQRLPQDHQTFTGLVMLPYFVLILVGTLNHAMWRDEIGTWLVSRDSPSLPEFFANVQYGGHPALWYLCLRLLSYLTPNPIAMQLFHGAIVTGMTYLFVRYSPFPRWQTLLFCAGYFPLYEYAVISRNYSLELLFLFGFCTLFPQRTRTYLPLSILLALMANTHVYGLLIGFALGITLIVEGISQHQRSRLKNRIGDVLGSLGIFGGGLALSVLQLQASASTHVVAPSWLFQWDVAQLTKVLTRIWNAYIMVLVPKDQVLWETSLFALLALVLVAFTVGLLIRQPIALLFYLFSTTILLSFMYVKYIGTIRHYGHLYVVWITALWLAAQIPDSEAILQFFQRLSDRLFQCLQTWISFTQRHRNRFLALILTVQLIAGAIAFIRDLTLPYSAGRETAQFIQQQNLDQMFIVGSNDFAVTTVSGYLNRPIYYPEQQKLGTFSPDRPVPLPAPEVLRQVSEQVRQRGKILLILNYPLSDSRSDLQITPIAQFTRSLIGSEQFYLYFAEAR